MFLEGISYCGRQTRSGGADSFFALGYSQGDFGADGFFSHMEDLKSSDTEKMESGGRGIKDNPWGMRSRGFGMLVCENGASVALTREETTSLWAIGSAKAAGGASGVDAIDAIDGFDVRRVVGERLTLGYTGRSNAMLYGSTIRVERWALGATRCGPQGFSSIGGADVNFEDPLDYNETQRRNFSYALDTFLGVEPASGLRLGVQANRLAARRLGDIEERPQYRAGLQIDVGQSARLTLEKDINESARLPFPEPQRSEAMSLKIRANGAATFSVGAERKTIGEASAIRYGAALWLTGKKHHIGAAFRFGDGGSPWGVTWKMH